jgi:mannose-6-phosphate isomerase-like protein (cupin superfamily)
VSKEKNYKDIVVKKPWGKEYLIYQNKNLGIWYLHIEKDQQTSMHCHPKKNTGLVVLDGSAEVSFLKNKISLKGVDKIMIFRGRFHSTKAVSDGGAHIIEVEAPQDKHDLVRLNDSYGREGKPYEGRSEETQKSDDCLWLEDPKDEDESTYLFNNCEFKIEKIRHKDKLCDRKYEESIIFLDGGIVSESGDCIIQPGDVIAGHTLNQLVPSFNIADETTIMSIYRSDL